MVFHISVRYAESTKVNNNTALIEGEFSVKQNKVQFNLVGTGMHLEQTINCWVKQS